jgi:hypothetical protein
MKFKKYKLNCKSNFSSAAHFYTFWIVSFFGISMELMDVLKAAILRKSFSQYIFCEKILEIFNATFSWYNQEMNSLTNISVKMQNFRHFWMICAKILVSSNSHFVGIEPFEQYHWEVFYLIRVVVKSNIDLLSKYILNNQKLKSLKKCNFVAETQRGGRETQIFLGGRGLLYLSII